MSESIHLGVYDESTVLNDGGAITASKAGYVDSAAKVLDLGAAIRTTGKAIFNVTAAGTASGQKQTLKIQVSDDSFDADIVDVAILELGDAAQVPGDTDVGIGQYSITHLLELQSVTSGRMRFLLLHHQFQALTTLVI